MDFEKYAGLASIVGIVLIGAIALDFSKWQPLMAALIALGGGTMAYQAAMAKVLDDRAARASETARLQLSVCLQVDFACREIWERASEILDFIQASQVGFVALPGDYSGLSFDEPPELAAVWGDRLDLLPRDLIGEVARVRNLLRSLQRFDARIQATGQGGRTIDSDQTAALMPTVEELRDTSKSVRDRLATEIPQLSSR